MPAGPVHCLPRATTHPRLPALPLPAPSCQALYESLREKVFIAERALLYVLDFQFNIGSPFKVGGPAWRQLGKAWRCCRTAEIVNPGDA